jgi:hypothetical protein
VLIIIIKQKKIYNKVCIYIFIQKSGTEPRFLDDRDDSDTPTRDGEK